MKNVIENLLKHVTGSERITARMLADMSGILPSHQTIPRVRKIIRKMIAEGTPVGSDATGFFMITEHDELEDVLEGLQMRCDALQERIVDITKAYTKVRDSLHLNMDLDIKDRCRYFVIYIAETSKIPYQAVWTMAYRKLQKRTGVDLVNLPLWYQGSVLNYVTTQGLIDQLYEVLSTLEGVLSTLEGVLI